MKKAKMLLFPLGGAALMIAVALALAWVTATPRRERGHLRLDVGAYRAGAGGWGNPPGQLGKPPKRGDRLG